MRNSGGKIISSASDGRKTASWKSMRSKHFLTPCTKINSELLKGLNIRQDTINLLEKNIGKTFSDINCSTIFLRLVSQSSRNKNKNKQIEPNKTYKLLHSEGNHKMKKQPTEWEKIPTNDPTNKGLISKIYKQLVQLNNSNKKSN